MKKITLTMLCLLTSTMSSYATRLTDHDVVSVTEKFDTADVLKKSNPEESNTILHDIQNEHGMKDDFNLIFGERYDQLKSEIQSSLNPAPTKISTGFYKIIISDTNPGRFPELENATLYSRGLYYFQSATKPGGFTELENAPLYGNDLYYLKIDPNKTSKEGIEEALNPKKHELLNTLIPANLIDIVHLKVYDIDITGGSKGSFSSRIDKNLLNMKPTNIGLDEAPSATSTILSITIE